MCSRTQKIAAAAATAAVVGQFHLYGAVTVASSIDAALFDGNAVSVIGSAAAAGASTTEGAPNTRWTCPMHPHYIAEEFGACPICGMDLVKLASSPGALSAGSVEARAIVTIAPEVVQNIGVRLGKAEQVDFGRGIRSYGLVQENERLVSEITARVEGWVEDLSVTAVGDDVKPGMRLYKLYAPQLIVSQNDYIGSLNYMGSLNDSRLARGGLRQLRSFGVQERTLKQIEERREAFELVPFYAERGGKISELNLTDGAYVQRGMMLARIQDYSSVWLIVAVAEKDLSLIGEETGATVTFPNLPGEELQATVDYIYPTIDPDTRTGRVRLVIDNPEGRIRPGSYADVTFQVGTAPRLAIPSEAVLKNGQGRHVVVSLGEGRFEPRRVRIGLISDGWTEVLSGLDGGEDIVVSGQFLIDSESALRESFRKLERLKLPLSLLQLSRSEFAMIDHFVDAALYVHEALVDGYDVDPTFLDPAISVRDLMWLRYGDTQLSYVLDDAVAALRDAQNARTLSETRAALQSLVNALRPWVMDGAPGHYQSRDVILFQDTAERTWLQLSGRPFNPFGQEAADQVPFPEMTEPDAPSEAQPAEASAQVMKGRGHGGH